LRVIGQTAPSQSSPDESVVLFLQAAASAPPAEITDRRNRYGVSGP